MFCPSCGTKNSETATTCTQCGFGLAQGGASKFKGTMVMTAPSELTGSGAPATPAPAAPAAAPKPGFKGTMIGVAPPGISHAPGATPGAQGGGSASAPPGYAPPASPAGFGAQPPAQAPSPAAPAPSPGFGGGQGVNPLGGTMALDQVPFPPGGFGAPAPAPSPAASPMNPPPAAPPAGPSAGAIAGGLVAGAASAMGGYGAPPAPPGPGAGPAPGGYAPPPSPPGFGGPQPGFGGAQPGFGSAPAFGGGYGGAMAPRGATGPKGTVRNPLTVMVLSFVTCGLYGIFAFWGMLSELKAYLQKDEIQPIFMFIPLLNLLLLFKLPDWVSEAKQRAGCQNPQSSGLILYWLFGIYFLPKDLNEVWEAR